MVKIESCHNANFVVNNGITGCRLGCGAATSDDKVYIMMNFDE